MDLTVGRTAFQVTHSIVCFCMEVRPDKLASAALLLSTPN